MRTTAPDESDRTRAETALYGERDAGALRLGRELFACAGLTPHDVDAAMVFDHFTMAVPLSLEQYGFCDLGGGGPLIESGATGPGGALPVNTHGGSNGEAFVHGVNHLREAVRQIRGTSSRPSVTTSWSLPFGPSDQDCPIPPIPGGFARVRHRTTGL